VLPLPYMGKSMSIHSPSCRCSLHAPITTSRHECYRQLAKAILGGLPPQDDLALASALAVDPRFKASTITVRSMSQRLAA
jgi:hypothetical protein